MIINKVAPFDCDPGERWVSAQEATVLNFSAALKRYGITHNDMHYDYL